MLSYIHAYHAGNHADILKHLTLSFILDYLCKKEKPFTVIDTHAGSGLYSFEDERAQKTGEAESGVQRLIRTFEKEGIFTTHNENNSKGLLNDNLAHLFSSLPPAAKYFNLISKYYSNGQYPGSPLIENFFLRPGDEQILSEFHPTAFEELKNCFYNRRKFCDENGLNLIEPQIHKRDGYEMLKAVTPPKIKRGLCVIDPSFEDASDFEKCGEVISRVHKKWSTGIIALWYPLVSHRSAEISMMKERIAGCVESDEPRVLDIQMEVKRKEDMTGLASLYGSGMFIVNFPYKMDEEMKEILPFLAETLGETSHEWSVEKR